LRRGRPAQAGEIMPRMKSKWKEPEMEKVIDSFEGWLEKQKSKPVKAKPGFIAEAKIERS
jgi:hypothetical protein